MIALHLAEAERHVVQGERNIARQRNVLATLERDGHDAGQARKLLATFEELQAMHIADRDRLREELRNADRT